MGISAATATMIALGVGTTASVGMGLMNMDAQKSAQAQAAQQAAKQQELNQEQINKANAKQPNLGAFLSQNMLAAKNGNSGTMLTGPQGVDPNSLSLGKSTLLGQ